MKEPTQDQSLVAAIEGDFNGMSRNDLILTCQMLTRGREIWRKQCEAAEAKLDELATDKERLDWMLNNKAGCYFNSRIDKWVVQELGQVVGCLSQADNTRTAIDKAMKEK